MSVKLGHTRDGQEVPAISFFLFTWVYLDKNDSICIKCLILHDMDSIAAPGVLKCGFGKDVLLRNLKVDPYKYRFIKKKWPILIPISPILGQILKNRPIHIPISVFYKGSFIYEEPDFATYVGSTSQ